MTERIRQLIDRLEQSRSLTVPEYAELVAGYSEEAAACLADKARRACSRVYGDAVFIRGLIEIGNVCRNDCLYCGIRRSNRRCARYRLSADQILSCCREGYALGFRTFVLQGGEDPSFSVEAVCALVRAIKAEFADCAVTLSLGEYPTAAYQAMFDAGADRYLLRHETADRAHYQSLHPPALSFDNRMRCLRDLKAIGFQTGCGFMVGSPCQTAQTLAKDLKFVRDLPAGDVRHRAVYPAQGHPVWGSASGQRAAHALSSVHPAAHPAEPAPACDDRARHTPIGRQGAGHARRGKRRHAKPVPAGRAGKIHLIQRQAAQWRRIRPASGGAAAAHGCDRPVRCDRPG